MRIFGKEAVFASLIAILASATNSQAQEFRFKLHHFNSPQSLAHQIFLVPWAKDLEAASGGRIKIDVFPSMQLGGKPEDLFSQVRDGVVELAWTLPGYSAGQFPLTSVMELPFLAPTTEIASKVLMDLHDLHLKSEYASVKVIALHTTDPNALHSIPAVKTSSDFKGLKVRVASRWVGQTIEALGGTPISLPLPEIAQATARNQIDAFVIGWSVTRPFKLYELVKNHTEVSFGTSPAMFAMNKKAYESLPPDLQRLIDQRSGIQLSGRLGRAWDEDVEKSREAARKRGNAEIQLPPAEIAKWKETVRPVVEGWISVNAKRGESRKLYEDTLKLIEQHSR